MLDFVDLSHHNMLAGRQFDFANIQAGGCAMVVHKASEGLKFHDPQFAVRLPLIQQAGMVAGAYHFLTGDPGDPTGEIQAVFFLHSFDPAGIVLALDVETEPNVPSPTIAQIRGFIRVVHGETGRYPLIYGGMAYLGPLIANNRAEDITICPHWHAAYSAAPKPMPGWGDTPLAWQYTDGRVGPKAGPTAGAGYVDRSVFFGDIDDLRALAGLPLDIHQARVS